MSGQAEYMSKQKNGLDRSDVIIRVLPLFVHYLLFLFPIQIYLLLRTLIKLFRI